MKPLAYKTSVILVLAAVSFIVSSCEKPSYDISNDATTATSVTTSTTTITTTAPVSAIENIDTQPLTSLQQQKFIADDFSPKIDFSYNIEKCPINEDIFATNIERINSFSNFGSKFTVEYIETENDDATKHKVLSDVKALSDEICNGLSSDHEKAYAISIWVSRNIFYDTDAAHNDVSLEITNLENVMETKKTTCAGYANLFSALCNAQGIFSLNIRGGAPEHEEDTLENVSTNHEWNAVFIDEQWVFFDTTWASENFYIDGEYLPSPNLEYYYLGMDFYSCSLYRRVDRVDFRNFFSAYNEIYN